MLVANSSWYIEHAIISDNKNNSFPTATKQNVPKNAFEDLLGGFSGGTKKDAGPKTLKAMKHDELSKEMDPDKLKVSKNGS